MKYLSLSVIILSLQVFSLTGQTVTNSASSTTASDKLREISISKMEDSAFWYHDFSRDDGIMQLRSFDGGSKEKVAIEEDSDSDENVIGAKVYFFRRGVMNFTLSPIRPLPIEGITKTISVWVAGRNANHEMDMLLLDSTGKKVVLPMGKLNFSGWKKLTVTIPSNIMQVKKYYGNIDGIQLAGFKIRCDIDETYGRYYVYFDDIRAVTDLYGEDVSETDDMIDAW